MKVWTIIVREWRENLRQRWLVATLATVFTLIAALTTWLLATLDGFAAEPGMERKVAYWLDVLGMAMDDPLTQLTSTTVWAFDYLVVTQLLSMTAVLAGHAALHDRQVGTLPFLLLAPITRLQMIAGKVLGAMTMPLLVYVAIGAPCAFYAGSLPVTAGTGSFLPPSAGWLIAFFLGGPAWATFIGTLCVAISSVARDVRTAQQAAQVLVLFATFVMGPLLVDRLSEGAMTQLLVAGAGVVLAVGAMLFGAALISRDLGR